MAFQNGHWISSFFEDSSLVGVGVGVEEWPPQPILLISPDSRRSCSAALESPSRKRPRDEHSSSKANREKMRRDKLNDKFMELSCALDPGKPLRSDKSTILVEAACIVKQLREEVKQLRASNEKLREAVQDLKAEKNELREEKVRLKAEKDRMDEQLKTFSLPMVPHPAAFHAFMAQSPQPPQSAGGTKPVKGESSTNRDYPAMAMWQWMPASHTDIAQDGLLRPPVA